MELKVLPVFQVLIATLLMVLITRIFPQFNFELSTNKIFSLGIFLLAMIVGLLAVYCFKQHQTTVNPTKPENASKVVDSGIYALSRNPMYLALVLVLISLCFYLHNVSAFFILPPFIWYITKYQIIPEEQALTILFGEDFESYCSRVRRWV